jgi:hypothetical protein
MPMKCSVATLVVLLALAGLAAPVRADADARDAYAGVWKGTGMFYATPYSKAGPSSDTTTCRWESGRAYLVCSQTNESPYGPGVQLSIYARKGDGYVFDRVDRDGTIHTGEVAVAGTTWTYPFAFTDRNGKRVLMRTINDFSTPGVNKWRSEFSIDDGKTWTRTAEGVETKVARNEP